MGTLPLPFPHPQLTPVAQTSMVKNTVLQLVVSRTSWNNIAHWLGGMGDGLASVSVFGFTYAGAILNTITATLARLYSKAQSRRLTQQGDGTAHPLTAASTALCMSV